MSKLLTRLLLFLTAIPLVAAVVLLLPQQNHLALNCVVLVFSCLGAVEFRGFLRQKFPEDVPGKAESAILGGIVPLAAVLEISFHFPAGTREISFYGGVFWLLVSRVFSAPGKFRGALEHAVSGMAVMVYPGFLASFAIRLSGLPASSLVILVYFVMVLGNDSLAWAAGMLFGKNNRGLVQASPNKSIAGFAGGFLASIMAGLGAAALLPDAFTSPALPSPLAGLVLGFFTGASAILGDLAESVFKRSSAIKDSGTVIPGRGGVLDTIDSLALAAPFYYFCYRLLFLGGLA